MKKVLIDTNIYSLAMKGDANVVDALRRIDLIGFSAISIGELYSGFKGGSRETGNREQGTGKNSIFFWILQESLFTILMKRLLIFTLQYSII